MKILGIETSCDETAASVVEDGTRVLSSVVASSEEMHKETGGIVPENAARAQIKAILPVLEKALNGKADVDAIAVTIGPGLIGSLLVGVETAKTLSTLWEKPIIPVNHLVAHLFANYLTTEGQKASLPEFPAIGLIVSGGHTDMIHMNSGPHNVHNFIEWIGGTRDDAAGEAFDKCARLLGLPYPGGPAIAAMAERLETANFNNINLFPRPMIDSGDFDFSFSGLKTAVLNYTKRNSDELSTEKLAAEIQEAIVDVLIEKSIRAVKEYRPKSFLLAGGVAANKRLIEKFSERLKAEKLEVDFYYPKPRFATDNGAVVASAAYFVGQPKNWQDLAANPELGVVDRV